MKRNKRRLYFSLFTLVALLVVAYFMAKQSGWFNDYANTNDSPLSNFAFDDTTTIDKFIITKSSGEKAELAKDKNGDWIINGKAKAKPENISLILQTFKNVRVRSRVGAAGRNNVIKNIAAFHRKVQIFQNGEWVKTWYVGNPSADRTGTYFLLETPEDGKSSEPYIMSLPGFHGQLDIRFFTEEDDWKFTGVFLYNPEHITSIRLESSENAKEGFTLKQLPARKLQLLDDAGKAVGSFDTLTARSYTFFYRKVHFEHFAKKLSYYQMDSLRKAKPIYKITVTDNTNKEQWVAIYHMPNYGKAKDLEGKEYEYNPEKAYAILSSGEVVVVQYHVFDKLIRPLSSFMRVTEKPK